MAMAENTGGHKADAMLPNPTGPEVSDFTDRVEREARGAEYWDAEAGERDSEVFSSEHSVAFKGNHGPGIGMRFKWEQLSLRADVQDTYSVCSALLTGFSVCAQHISKDQVAVDGNGETLKFYALCGQQFLLRLSTIMGTYGTLIFMLSSMYMKTSLSRPVYGLALFQIFCDKTADLRRSAFNSMCGSFVTFGVSVVLSLFYSFSVKIAACLSLLIIPFVIMLLWHGYRMLDDAKMLFITDEETLEHILFASKDAIDEDVLLEAEKERDSIRKSMVGHDHYHTTG